MNGTEKDQNSTTFQDDQDTLTELFRHVSARRQPPAEDEKIVRQALHEQWRQMTAGKRTRPAVLPWAIAATVVLAVVAVSGIRPWATPSSPAPIVASAERVIGSVTIRPAERSKAFSARQQDSLEAGQTLTLGSGAKLALRWINGVVIRLDEQTELQMISEEQVFLARGRIYLDTAPANPSAHQLTVLTPHGKVRHVGTQFITQVSAAGTSISVREGEVAYFPPADGDSGRTLANQGQQLSVTSDGRISVQLISTWGPDWEWAEALSSGFSSDGRSLAELLSWAGRESGRKVRYQSPEAEATAKSTLMRGDLHVQPVQALSIATATSDLVAEVSDGWIIVRRNRID